MKSPAFQFYSDRFIAGTITMTNEERGLYITLLCLQWNQGSITEDDAKRLSTANGKTIGLLSLKKVISKFQKTEDGSLQNPRLEEVRREQDEFRENRRKSGELGAKVRWHSHSTAIAQPLANGMANDSPPDSTSVGGTSSTSPTEVAAERWLLDCQKNGADYTLDEMRSSFLSLKATGWMWGRNPVVDWRAALERQIQTDRRFVRKKKKRTEVTL